MATRADEGQTPASEPVTIVSLSGEALQDATPPPSMADHLAQTADEETRRLAADEAQRLASLPIVSADVGSKREELRRLEQDIAKRKREFRAMEEWMRVKKANEDSQRFSLLGVPIEFWGEDRMVDELNKAAKEVAAAARGSTDVKPPFEAKDPARGVRGYYRRHTARELKMTRDGRAEWLAPQDVQSVELPTGQPSEWSTIVRLRPRGILPIIVREGEVPIAIEADGPVRVFRVRSTGDWIVVSDYPVTIYQASAREGSGQRPPPTQEDSEQILRPEELPPRWKNLIEAIQKDPGLSLSARAALIIDAWRRAFVYDTDPRNDRQAQGGYVSQVAKKILTRCRGICNYSATGLVVLLRAAGVPARYVSGFVIEENASTEKHAYVDYWTGERWEVVEPQSDGAQRSVQAGHLRSRKKRRGKKSSDKQPEVTTATAWPQESHTKRLIEEHRDKIKNLQFTVRVPLPSRRIAIWGASLALAGAIAVFISRSESVETSGTREIPATESEGDRPSDSKNRPAPSEITAPPPPPSVSADNFYGNLGIFAAGAGFGGLLGGYIGSRRRR